MRSGAFARKVRIVEAGIARFQKPPRQIEPDESLTQFYRDRFTVYQQLVQRLAYA